MTAKLRPMIRTRLLPLLVVLLSLGLTTASAVESANSDWPVYLGCKGRVLYSLPDQLNHDTVAKLTVAWTCESGDKSESQANNQSEISRAAD